MQADVKQMTFGMNIKDSQNPTTVISNGVDTVTSVSDVNANDTIANNISANDTNANTTDANTVDADTHHRPKSTARKSGKSRLAKELPASYKGKIGTRAQVARGTAIRTVGGLSLSDGLFKKGGRIRSIKASEVAKVKWANNPSLQTRAELVKAAFLAVKTLQKSGQKIKAQEVVKNPAAALAEPEKYIIE
jgi:hypothetical protein